MGVVIKPLEGLARGSSGELEPADAGVDVIYLESKQTPVPKRIGIVGREPGAPVCLTEPGLSESVRKEIERAVEARHGEAPASMKLAPPIEKGKK